MILNEAAVAKKVTPGRLEKYTFIESFFKDGKGT